MNTQEVCHKGCVKEFLHGSADIYTRCIDHNRTEAQAIRHMSLASDQTWQPPKRGKK